MSIHVCECAHNGATEHHLRYPGMTCEVAQQIADQLNAGALSNRASSTVTEYTALREALSALESINTPMSAVHSERKRKAIDACRSVLNAMGESDGEQAPYILQAPALAMRRPELRLSKQEYIPAGTSVYISCAPPAVQLTQAEGKALYRAQRKSVTFVDEPCDSPGDSVCEWSIDSDADTGVWRSGCGESWSFIDGGPNENRVYYCHRCGKPLKIQASAGIRAEAEHLDRAQAQQWKPCSRCTTPDFCTNTLRGCDVAASRDAGITAICDHVIGTEGGKDKP